jgi:hypothetical protein
MFIRWVEQKLLTAHELDSGCCIPELRVILGSQPLIYNMRKPKEDRIRGEPAGYTYYRKRILSSRGALMGLP